MSFQNYEENLWNLRVFKERNVAINLKCFFSSIDSKLTMTHNFY